MLIIILSALLSIMTFYWHSKLYYLIGVLGLLLISILSIIKYFNGINRWISYFLLGIENEDSSLRIPPSSGNKNIDDIYKGINRLNSIFKQTKIDISIQEQYYKSVINQSATGLFSVNENLRIININPAAMKLTGLYEYHHLNTLLKIDKALPEFILKSNSSNDIKSAIFENQYGQKLLFKVTEIHSKKEEIKLVAVSDITKELDNREVDAWIKLARTLSHEIMNNIAPITSLSQVISSYFVDDNIKNITPKIISNTQKGLAIIEKQSSGLISFVENYRKFTKLPTPKLKNENISELLNNLIIAGTTFSNTNIVVEKSIPNNIWHKTDEKLFSQVLINIFKNANEALNNNEIDKPTIRIQLRNTNNHIKIEIYNNGPKIPAEIREQIFVPFFTTKENGSGIGLSLSKQIMLTMGGDIILKADNNKGSCFIISLAN
jgi:nitrogen fixation/metabolism regulation signal transduction histidine kinase